MTILGKHACSNIFKMLVTDSCDLSNISERCACIEHVISSFLFSCIEEVKSDMKLLGRCQWVCSELFILC